MKSRILIGGGILAVGGLIWGTWKLLTAPNLERSAEDVIEATLAGDAERLMNLASPTEIALSGLNQRKLKEFLDRVFLPGIDGFKATGPVQHLTQVTRLDLYSGLDLEHSDGRKTSLSFQFHIEDGQVKVDDLVSGLLNTVSFRKRPGDPENGIELFRHVAQGYTNLLPVLNELELKGLALRRMPTGEYRFETWEIRRNYTLKQIERLEQGLAPTGLPQVVRG